MDQEPMTTTTGHDEGLSQRAAVGSTVAQLVLLPVIAFAALGLAFFGYGLTEDSGAAANVVVITLYLIVGITILLLVVGTPTLWIARRAGRSKLACRAARVPLRFAVVSAAILLGLYVAGAAFDRVIGV